jgi:hypothetical protein
MHAAAVNGDVELWEDVTRTTFDRFITDHVFVTVVDKMRARQVA